jgi:hypothetical protein
MSKPDRNVTRGRPSWPLLGLLLVALFLGHDLLMAAEVAAAPPHETPVAPHASPDRAGAEIMPASRGSDPAPGHPEQCRIGQTAVSPTTGGDAGDAAGPGRAALTSVTLANTPGGTRHKPFAWEEPHWPPGTLRALWQVYRI